MIIAIAIFIIGFIIFGKRQRIEEFNPYIKAHRKKWKHQSQYRQYLDWLSKKGGDIPIPESKTKEEIEASQQIEKAMQKKGV